jgi:hypothetical protein
VNGAGPAPSDPAVSDRGDGGGSGGEHRRFRPDVEGLRAVAIVLVVLYHVHAGLAPGGYVGSRLCRSTPAGPGGFCPRPC